MEAVKAMKLLNTSEVAGLTGVPENTLRYYRHKRLGPKSGKLAGRVVYKESDVLAWVEAAFESGVPA
jgi:DNA-binding transcriptional MerR regulator